MKKKKRGVSVTVIGFIIILAGYSLVVFTDQDQAAVICMMDTHICTIMPVKSFSATDETGNCIWINHKSEELCRPDFILLKVSTIRRNCTEGLQGSFKPWDTCITKNGVEKFDPFNKIWRRETK